MSSANNPQPVLPHSVAAAGDGEHSAAVDAHRPLAAEIQEVLGQLVAQLAARKVDAHWTGRLATSALSTATACSALQLWAQHTSDKAESDAMGRLVERGLAYLDTTQNDDGGFGDTDRSPSNISTTLLVMAAWRIAGPTQERTDSITRAQGYVERAGGWEGLRRRYGKDKTFVVPILANCALAGMVDFRSVPSLPFEAACVPQRMYRLLRLPVVSYAIPALVAIGQLRHFKAPSRNPALRAVRAAAVKRSMEVLLRIQPRSGGYLEATPLTSFVLMSLAATGRADHAVSRAAVRFLRESVREDGSWPIDTDLATWVTSLAMIACQSAEDAGVHAARGVADDATARWLLSCQHRQRHPYTGADPGGWGWTDLSGAVPDADDTPAALIALGRWWRGAGAHEPSCGAASEERAELQRRAQQGAAAGIEWLLGLQNRDGGWPTFCRGWGKLPFDRSGTDLTAHAIRALRVWADLQGAVRRRRIERAIERGFHYLARQQRFDGSWLPLWFGNHDCADDENPVYGTARVLRSYVDLNRVHDAAAQRGLAFLVGCQNADGGWGGGASVGETPLMARRRAQTPGAPPLCSSVEETAQAVAALAVAARKSGNGAIIADAGSIDLDAAIIRGTEWLCRAVRCGLTEIAWPIGFYFAKLWYYEDLYPLVMTTEALSAVSGNGEAGATG